METFVVLTVLAQFVVAAANGQAVEPTIANNNLITQTVYGFLDFTTTIGNTVMIFSPQSSALNIGPKSTATTSFNEIIETQAPKHTTKQPPQIKPTKTEKPVAKKPQTISSEKIVTVVNVISQAPEKKQTENSPASEVVAFNAPPIISSKVQVVEASSQTKLPTSFSSAKEKTTAPLTSKVNVISNSDSFPFPEMGDNTAEAEYEFLSRQPSEVVEETYKVINLKPPNSKFILKPRASADPKKAVAKKTASNHPTGLVTKLGGTVVKEGATTVHETSVIGTYISGKYAQVLQSTSRVLSNAKDISPSPSLRILKTAAPGTHKGKKNHNVEPNNAASNNHETAAEIESNKSTKGSGKPFKLRHKAKQSDGNVGEEKTQTTSSYKKNSTRSRSAARRENTPHRNNKRGRGNRKTATTTPSSAHSDDEVTTSSSFSSPGVTKRYQSGAGRRNKQHRSGASDATNNNSGGGFSRRYFKPKVQASTVDTSTSTSLYKFKLNRSPGRWQYKTTPKPRVTIRKQNNVLADEAEYKKEVTPLAANDTATNQTIRQEETDGLEGSESVASIIDDSSIENKLDTPSLALETIKVEISTPPDFKDVYYEIATIKSPYTFQVGSVKNTRFITVTSTFEKSLENTEEPTIAPTSTAPLTENILATTSNYVKDNNFLDSSIATLPPIYLASDMETPPLETLTETFSTTETMLKTHILPVIHNPNATSLSTLVQTYLITRLVTATKTLPPMEAYHFNPSKTLNEFNSRLDEAGSELHLELDFGDQNEQDEDTIKRVFPPEVNLANVGIDFDLSNVDKGIIPEGHLKPKKEQKTKKPIQEPSSALSPEQLQQLALLRLLNPAAAGGQLQVITTSKPVLRVETIYESHVIPVTNGPNTFSTTLSKPVATITKTEYEFGTSTIAPGLPPALPFQPPVNPLFPQVPQAQPQFSLTSSPVEQTTIVTKTTSKVLKLTFGAKTAYTTVLSSNVVPTVITTYVTASVPVQPTAAYPGFYPAPYPPYPFVG